MRAVGSVIAGLLASAALGCGGGDSTLLGGDDAAELKQTLGQVRDAVDDRDCAKASARLLELRSQVTELKPPVARKLRVRLREEIADKLGPAVRDECDDTVDEVQPTVTSPATTGPTGPLDPEPEPTPTQTQTSESTPTPAPEAPDVLPGPIEPPSTPEPDPADPEQDPGGFGTDGAGG